MADIITFGCRLNACESDIIGELASELGIADYTIINTCAVTSEAERKLRQTIRRLYAKNHDIKIILTGCASELHASDYLKMDGVVGIVSNDKKLLKSEYEKYGTEEKLPSPPVDKVRGFLQIQNGCDHKCTYCVVRLTRGPNISFSEEEIISNAKYLLKKGYKEIVLTGVNVSSYGSDNGKTLSSLIRLILKEIPELSRLRLSSLDPADITDELICLIGSEPRLMPHIHESIQSGDDMILKRMLRRHTCEQVIKINQKICEARPDTIIGADIIVGFPTETDEMFLNTKKFLKEANITLLHVFPYSKRPGTPAALMPQVINRVKFERNSELLELKHILLDRKLQNYIGHTMEVLAETELSGKTDNFLSIKSINSMTPGEVYNFQCESVENGMLLGKVL